jgi:two-component system LytT family response regulator
MSRVSLSEVAPAKNSVSLLVSRADDFSGLTGHSRSNRHVEPKIQVVMAGLKDSVRNNLRPLLEGEPGLYIAAECQEAVTPQMIRKHDPDLLVSDCPVSNVKGLRFLDRSSGFDQRPLLVIVGSDEKQASRAFELNAVDFLVEPFCRTRVHSTVERVRRELCKSRCICAAKRAVRLPDLPTRPQTAKHLAFKSNGRIIFLNSNEIDWIEAAANYVRINAGGESYPMRERIGRLAGRLDSERFIRIHRSIIVNVHKIKELQPCNSGEYIAVLKNGKQLSCGRGFRDELDRFVSQCT